MVTKAKSNGNSCNKTEREKKTVHERWTKASKRSHLILEHEVKNRLNIQANGCLVISKPSHLPLNLIFIKTKQKKRERERKKQQRRNKKQFSLLSLNRIFCIHWCAVVSSPGTPVDITTNGFQCNALFFFAVTVTLLPIDDTTNWLFFFFFGQNICCESYQTISTSFVASFSAPTACLLLNINLSDWCFSAAHVFQFGLIKYILKFHLDYAWDWGCCAPLHQRIAMQACVYVKHLRISLLT